MQSTIDKEYATDNKTDTGSEMYVTFVIDSEVYGIDVNRVREIIGMIAISHIPNAASYMKGVINLRGRVVPVIDIRIKFNMALRTYDANTVILIVEFSETFVGLIVDSVADVLLIPTGSIHDYSGVDSKIKSCSIKSIASHNDSLILLLDLDRMIDEEEILSAEISTNE